MTDLAKNRIRKSGGARPLVRTRRVRTGGPHLSIYISLSMLLIVLSLALARSQHLHGSEMYLTQWSALYASICVIPVLWAVLRQPRSSMERILISLWWPLKIAFTFYYVFSVWDVARNPALYLHYSDNLPWQLAASRIADYWKMHGVGIIPKPTLVRMSMNYPAAGYFFGAIYYGIGHCLEATLPWLSLVVLLCAALAQRLLEQCGLSQSEAKVAFHFILWSPVMWLFTLLVARDPLIIFSWLVIAYGTILLFQRVNPINMAALFAGTIVLANLRAEYLFVELAWFAVVVAYSLKGKKRKGLGTQFALIGLVLACTALIAWGLWGHGGSSWYVTKYDLGEGVHKQMDLYLKEEGHMHGFYGAIISVGGALLIPVILPFKLLVGLTAPFPWDFSTFALRVTQPFYSLESIIRLALFFFSLRVVLNWRSFSRSWDTELKLILALGTLVGIAGLLGPVSEVRYLAPAIPFLVPAFSPFARKARYWVGGTVFAAAAIISLQLLYFLLRPLL